MKDILNLFHQMFDQNMQFFKVSMSNLLKAGPEA